MIPALFAKIDRPDLTVMDMCAAPGSKTCQMIESLSNTSNNSSSSSSSCSPEFSIPEGLVLANDIEWKRANMLAHQVLRLNSPASGVVNFDASCFPVLWDEEGKQVLFDRVLCDVPCTSDGTMRKNPDIWREWKTGNSIAIHHRQFRILLRGLELAKPGGRVVYSTCSLNPIEDEAVVAAALANFNGKVKLVAGPAVGNATYSIAAPRGEMYSGGRPGLSTWTVSPPGDAATHIDKYEDTPDQYKKKMLSSMWPPTDDSIKAQLHHCRRFFPHDINAGGFFVAAFEKVSDDAVDSNEESAATDKPAAEQRRGGRPVAVDAKPICKEYYPCPKESLDTIREFYGITEDMLPSELLWCRKDQPKKVFLLSKAAMKMVKAKTRSPFRVANLGVRAFQLVEIKHPKDENAIKGPPNWRIGQDGAPALLPLLNRVAEDKRQVIEIPSLEALAQLLDRKEATLEELGCGDKKTMKPGGVIATLPSSFAVHGGTVAVACMLAQSGKVQCYMDKLQAGALLQAVRDAIKKASQGDVQQK
ncbi:protein nucleolar, putative [Perkinsus marinus ATCC 50983]|uniref:Protein nucleolar, putative n=1 Tax=Perkinsus marinus (strain ATCC 50983 / TXsc) TaxID=423536 RepID=C5LXS5_PERM5|nr:protein nucleolar, putative [Perkinsus marinus ATCC 50983]EEQ98469.1 protein nucleolar, putative [Perkinsus marinus ATCC 50983]|eukprot:XP_002765752.1 protein nucleolar, putative [Perkinsus marinus ATCC 50983]